METTQAKYLGVTIDNKLSWNSHVNQVTKRANQTTAFLRRNLSSCSKDVKVHCYKSLVHPQLEYAATTWDPYTKTNSAKVEAVQRWAARFCFNDYRQTSSVSSMMQDLGWEQLQTRHQQNKTVMMYRIANNLVEIPANQYLTPTGVSTRDHQQQFLPYYCSVNAYQGPFFPSAIRLWNAPPASTVSAQSLDYFKVLICADIPRCNCGQSVFRHVYRKPSFKDVFKLFTVRLCRWDMHLTGRRLTLHRDQAGSEF